MQLASINVAMPTTVDLNGREFTTGIVKQAVSGPVAVGRLGLDGDGVASTEHHGGVDQAVYAYSTSDYAWWRAELGRDTPAGLFGENLTIDTFDSADMNVGDRFVFGGGVILEATAPRIPCSKLGARMGDAKFPRRFSDALRPGVYFRVIEAGTIEAGESITFESTKRPTVTMVEMVHLYYDRDAPPDRIEATLAAPVAERWRAGYE